MNGKPVYDEEKGLFVRDAGEILVAYYHLT